MLRHNYLRGCDSSQGWRKGTRTGQLAVKYVGEGKRQYEKLGMGLDPTGTSSEIGFGCFAALGSGLRSGPA